MSRSVNLAGKAGHRPSQLSGGQKQRVAIARALVNRPQFLFADEPCGALDKKTGEEILGIMQKLNMQGNTVLMVTHSRTDASYSKRIIHLVDGAIIRDEAVDRPTLGTLDPAAPTPVENELVTKWWRVAEKLSSPKSHNIRGLRHLARLSSSRSSQLAAAKALLRWPYEEVGDLIDWLLKKSDWVVRQEILKRSAYLPRQVAMQYMIRGLEDANPWIRYSALISLRPLASEINLNGEQKKILFQRLLDADERIRATAIMIIHTWADPTVEDFLHKTLFDPDARVRANTLEAIVNRKQTLDFQAEIEKLLIDPNNRVRANAVQAVSHYSMGLAQTHAAEMMNSHDVLMRSSGAWVSRMIKTDTSKRNLIHWLSRESEEIVINQLVQSLAQTR